MSDEQFIDDAIASAQASAQVANEAEIDSQELETEQDQTNEGEQKDAAKVEDDSPFPKKAVNALNRKERKIGQLNAELRQARAELARFQQQSQASQKPAAPQEDQYDNYGEYLKAAARFEAQQELGKQQADSQKLAEEQQKAAQYHEWTEQRGTAIDQQAAEIGKIVPELPALFEENLDIVQEFPPHVQQAFLESDPRDATLAFLALAQEGKLESLLNLSPARAAVEIGRAADRGAAILKSKQISKAPNPLTPNKGAGGGSKSLHQMSADELVDNWLNS